MNIPSGSCGTPIPDDFVHTLWDNQTFNSRLKLFLQQEQTEMENSKIVTNCQEQLTPLDSLIEEIGTVLTQNFKENVFKQSNELFTSNMYLIQEVDKIKATLDKLAPSGFATSFKMKTEMSTAEKEKFDSSLFFDQQSDIEIVNLRKNPEDIEDKITNLSFINSFVADVSTNSKRDEQLSDKINASLSKIQTSLEQRINQVEKEFSKRIEQVMKTIRHLIVMVERGEQQNEKVIMPVVELRREEVKKKVEQKRGGSFQNRSFNKLSSLLGWKGNA